MTKKKTKTPKAEEKPTNESVEKPTPPAPPPERALATQADVAGLRQDIADANEQAQEAKAMTGVTLRDAPKAPPPVLPIELETRARTALFALRRNNCTLDAVQTTALESAAGRRYAGKGHQPAIIQMVENACDAAEAAVAVKDHARAVKLAESKDNVEIEVTSKILLSKLSHLTRGRHVISRDDYRLLVQWVGELEGRLAPVKVDDRDGATAMSTPMERRTAKGRGNWPPFRLVGDSDN